MHPFKITDKNNIKVIFVSGQASFVETFNKNYEEQNDEIYEVTNTSNQSKTKSPVLNAYNKSPHNN